MSTGFIDNFTLTNCYVDTSYQEDGSIYTSKFSETEPQVAYIYKDLTIVPNDGFTLNENFSFNFRVEKDSEWITLTNEDFSPLEGMLEWDIIPERFDYKLVGLDLDQSLIYTSINDDWEVEYHLMLVGGFSPNKLVFVLLKPSTTPEVVYSWANYETHDFITYYPPGGWDPDVFSLLDELTFTAEGTGGEEPDVTENLFTTYYIDTQVIDKIRQSGTVATEIIINTYSYPIKFDDEQLLNTTIKTGYIALDIESKVFSRNINSKDIFIFDVPFIPDVTECYIRIPFNNNVVLKYEDVRGKTIRGYISYEVLTNTTTLFITDGTETLYKNVITVGIKVPFKPTGAFEGFSEPTIRLATENPKMFIKGQKKVERGNYMRGTIKEPISEILKDELDMLNQALQNGVYINDY